MGFDPVRDAVRNSPLSQNQSLPSPQALFTPINSTSTTTSSPNSYFTSPRVAYSALGSAGSLQSPTSLRRATDLSVLLNENDQVPSPSSFQRRPSSSGVSMPSPELGAARPRSSHLSHILQYPNGDGPSTPTFAQPLLPPPKQAAPLGSPLLQTRDRDIIPPSISRNRSVSSAVGAKPHPIAPKDTRRASSSSAASTSGSRSTPRTPEVSRMSMHNAPAPQSAGSVLALGPPPVPPPKRSAIPYAPRNRKTPPGSVLVPITDAERDFYRNLRKNPLKDRANHGKRKLEDVTNDAPIRNGREPPSKRARGMGVVAEYCKRNFT